MIAKARRVVHHTSKPKKELLSEALYFMLGSVLGLLILILAVWAISRDVILPGIAVAGINLSGKDTQQAKKILTEAGENYTPNLFYGEAEIKIPSGILVFDYDASIIAAQKLGREVSVANILAVLSGKTDLPLALKVNNEKFTEWIQSLAPAVEVTGKPASLSSEKNTTMLINGKDGIELDSDLLRINLQNAAMYLSLEKWEVPVKEKKLALTPEQVRNINARLNDLNGKNLTIKVDINRVELTTKELPSFVDLSPEYAGQISLETCLTFAQGLADRYDRLPQDAKFEFAEGKVKEFAPGLDGLSMNKEETARNIKEGIERLLTSEKTAEVISVIKRISPKVSTGEVNNLGITELVGRGESYYAHSIPNRVFNVGLASSRVTGALVPPGEEFSFNKTVGEISGATGYKTAYVIANGRTELGDGGGVCQVSTTLFRAVMNAGLPITERWAHAYRVGYYEQNSKPGIDATVYSPSKDFKFKNDTGSYILVQAINDPKNLHLIFEIYGTKDGRMATITTPVVSGVTPPPPDLYQDDPSLPVGTTKQVDWSAWGAKASFDYKVEKNGEVVFAKTFVSNYKPWANVYLRGTMGQ